MNALLRVLLIRAILGVMRLIFDRGGKSKVERAEFDGEEITLLTTDNEPWVCREFKSGSKTRILWNVANAAMVQTALEPFTYKYRS